MCKNTDYICRTCKLSLCSECYSKQEHQGHSLTTKSEFIVEVSSIHDKIKDITTKINDARSNAEFLIKNHIDMTIPVIERTFDEEIAKMSERLNRIKIGIDKSDFFKIKELNDKFFENRLDREVSEINEKRRKTIEVFKSKFLRECEAEVIKLNVNQVVFDANNIGELFKIYGYDTNTLKKTADDALNILNLLKNICENNKPKFERINNNIVDIPRVDNIYDIPRVDNIYDIPRVDNIYDIPRVDNIYDIPRVDRKNVVPKMNVVDIPRANIINIDDGGRRLLYDFLGKIGLTIIGRNPRNDCLKKDWYGFIHKPLYLLDNLRTVFTCDNGKEFILWLFILRTDINSIRTIGAMRKDNTSFEYEYVTYHMGQIIKLKEKQLVFLYNKISKQEKLLDAESGDLLVEAAVKKGGWN